jgi:signal transduction histidine kinase
VLVLVVGATLSQRDTPMASRHGPIGRCFRGGACHQVCAQCTRICDSSRARARSRIAGERIQLIQPIRQKGEWLGTISLSARYDVRGRINAYFGIFGFVIALSVLVSLVLSAVLQRVITDPLDAMADVARQVVDREDYTPRAQPSKDIEIGVVVAAFNRMLDKVQHRTLALKQTQDALREADRRKDEFLATLAHELRNPLAPIRHAVKLLELPAADERQRQWGRDVIARQVQRMALLLDDLLEVSRITADAWSSRKLMSICRA